jgi:trehalose/maltose hydrolase-like predicted phosphorylase
MRIGSLEKMRKLVLCLLALALVSSCRAPQQARAPVPQPARPAPPAGPPVSDPWLPVSSDPAANRYPPYLGNGYLGFQVGISGCGWDGQAALPAYVAGLYVDETLTPIPSPAAVSLQGSNGEVLGAKAEELSGYAQRLSFRGGHLSTHARWQSGSAGAEVDVDCLAHRARPHLAVTRIRVRNIGGTPLTVAAPAAPFAPPFSTAPATALGATGALEVAEATASGGTRVAIATLFQPAATAGGGQKEYGVEPGQPGDFTRFSAVYSSLDGPDPAAAAAREVSAAQAAGWDALERSHAAAWAQLWQGDIEIEGDAEAQAVARACRFYLLESVRPELDSGVPPMGLSAAAFGGHVFWDMDSWMLPAVLPQEPGLAKAMFSYRNRTLPGAKANAQAEGKAGAAYAWESAATGREVSPEPFRRGRHIDGDVALAARQYWRATHDTAWLRAAAWPVLRATADYWVSRAERGSDGNLHIRQVSTPDENAGLVDDSAWTLYGARANLEFAAEAARTLHQPVPPAWEKTAAALTLPRDPKSGLIQEYAGYDGKPAKQADTLLLLHPGGMPASPEETTKLYDYYAGRVIQNGPAMTDAIHAILAARLSRGDEALTRFRAAYQPFLRQPFGMFSEKRSKDNLCFLTGAAGVLQSLLYGFAGLQLDDTRAPVAHPCLPSGWTSLTVHRIAWRGRHFDLRVDRAGAHWTAGP